MPTVIRDTPAGYDWGWYSREEPRMHLPSLNEKHEYKVWLEERGTRIFQPADKIPAKVLKPLQKHVSAHRQFIEDRWVRIMIKQGWLSLHFAAPFAVLSVYPNTPNRFTRTLDLAAEFPGAIEEMCRLKPADVRLSAEKASLEIYPQLPDPDRMDVRLSRIIWEG
jgi:hypothetical protein